MLSFMLNAHDVVRPPKAPISMKQDNKLTPAASPSKIVSTSNTKCANSSSTADSASAPSTPPNTSSTSPQTQAYRPSNTVLLPQTNPPQNLTNTNPLQKAKANPQAHAIGTDLFIMQPALPPRPTSPFPSCERPTPPSAQADKSRYSTSSCAARDGRDMQKAEKYKQWLEEIGFVDVVDVELMVPGNAWPEDDRMREIGRHLVQVQPGPLLSLGSYFGATDLSGVLDGLAPDMLRDMEDESIRLCWPIHVVYGRKALQDESA
ncbi:uncharacterized protein G6M90_00g108310 [Metarhizium brunneum]|uniref:Uncharacterized protein n=1 Tax=Metarhizium brunneum TaxID=500148 RepID=A0A7D5Z0W2_9HYPO|nr:hypothetical protein G6M90_00g108310 [Metarhizium brunneum]